MRYLLPPTKSHNNNQTILEYVSLQKITLTHSLTLPRSLSECIEEYKVMGYFSKRDWWFSTHVHLFKFSFYFCFVIFLLYYRILLRICRMNIAIYISIHIHTYIYFLFQSLTKQQQKAHLDKQ